MDFIDGTAADVNCAIVLSNNLWKTCEGREFIHCKVNLHAATIVVECINLTTNLRRYFHIPE